MESSAEKLNVSDLSILTVNVDVSDLSITGEEGDQIAPNIEDTLEKRGELSSADKLLVEYLRKHEQVFTELDDVRNKVGLSFDLSWLSKIWPTLTSV